MWASIVRMLANRVIKLHAMQWDRRLTENDKATIKQINNSVTRLAMRRAVEINVSGPFARSKIAWKLAVYQHALLYRVVALTNGASIAWNQRASLSAFLAARALMETVAAMAGFEHRLTNLLATEDLGELDALAMRATYASREPDWLADFPESKAINAQTYIKQYDNRVLAGFEKHYDMLSERCHPNSLGHNFFFAELDRTDGTVRFFDERHPERNGQLILAALAPLPLVETMMDRLDDLILKVSDLHHRLSPVGGIA